MNARIAISNGRLETIDHRKLLSSDCMVKLVLELDIRPLRHRSFRLLHRKAAFSVRLPIPWNKFPIDIVNFPTLDTFKRLLDSAWFSLFPSLP